jgi:hypothetical protein
LLVASWMTASTWFPTEISLVGTGSPGATYAAWTPLSFLSIGASALDARDSIVVASTSSGSTRGLDLSWLDLSFAAFWVRSCEVMRLRCVSQEKQQMRERPGEWREED